MPRRRPAPVTQPERPPRLTVPKSKAERDLQRRVEAGTKIRDRQIASKPPLDVACRDYAIWDDYNRDLLSRMFDNDSEQKQYSAKVDIWGFYSATLEEEVKDFRDEVDIKVRRLESLLGRLDLIEEAISPSAASAGEVEQDFSTSRVFIVHGRDDGLKQTVARFIERLDLKVIILDEQPGRGRTIIEKFEDHASEVGYAIVLLSPDDVGKLDGSADEEQRRARQNVLFELGYFAGKLGRGRVCMLRAGDLEIPSDLAGVEYVSFESDWRRDLTRELKAAGLAVNLDKEFGG